MKFSLVEVAGGLGLKPPAEDRMATGWSVDTRTLAAGDVFFALRGPNHDGHGYVAQAFEKGAAAVVVDHEVACAGPALVVGDTQTALEQLGRWARVRWNGDVVGVTGSAGKTTTKDCIAAMLSAKRRVAKTAGNLNNHVGVPLSLLRLPEESEVAVLEMGMNHAGEIAHLASIAMPRIGVVTNVGAAHVENFESVEGVAAAKRELVEALPADGVAVLNADDARVAAFAGHCKGRSISFGISAAADVRAERVEYSTEGVKFQVKGETIESRMLGRHGVLNLLAGVAVASLYGIQVGDLKDAARLMAPGAMRGARLERGGILHFNDCYNSNPDAARAMVDLLADTPGARRIAVLGEMLELGRLAEALHRDVGRYVAARGIPVLVGIRGAARHAVEAAREAGLNPGAACFFDDPVEAGAWVRSIAAPGDVILWKGSRGTRVELALERFLQ